MTKITLENESGIYTVEVPENGLCISELIMDVVIPVIKAAGYYEKSIKEAMEDYAEEYL